MILLLWGQSLSCHGHSLSWAWDIVRKHLIVEFRRNIFTGRFLICFFNLALTNRHWKFRIYFWFLTVCHLPFSKIAVINCLIDRLLVTKLWWCAIACKIILIVYLKIVEFELLGNKRSSFFLDRNLCLVLSNDEWVFRSLYQIWG